MMTSRRAIERPNAAVPEATLVQALHAPEPSPEVMEMLPSFPWKIQLQTFSLCNAACTMCPWPETKHSLDHGRMEESTFRLFLQQCAGQDLERLSLFLHNEPLVDRRITAWVRLAKEALPRTEAVLYTNGWLLTPALAQELALAGVDEINLSLFAADPVVVEKYAPGTPLLRILENLEAISQAIEAGNLSPMRMSIAALNLSGAEESFAPYAARWEKRGLPIYYAPVTNRAGNAKGWEDFRSPRRVVCQRPFTKAYVLYDGRVLLCNCDWNREVVLGNILEQSLAEIWRGAAYRAIREELLSGKPRKGSLCAKCDYPYAVSREIES